MTVFTIVDSKLQRRRNHKAKKKVDDSLAASHVVDTAALPDAEYTLFPPPPVNNKLSQKIISAFCADSSLSVLEEAGCAVCGLLVPGSQLTQLKAVKDYLDVLQVPGTT